MDHQHHQHQHHHGHGGNHHQHQHHHGHGGNHHQQHCHKHSHGHGHQDLEDFLPKLISTLTWGKRGENILDYGCGPGQTGYKYILPEVLKYDSNLYSVDVNEGKVESAKKNFAHEKITYAVGNVLEGFPFDNVQFDKIFSIYVFHFVPDINKALTRLNSLLIPGGQLAFTMHKTYYFNVLKALSESPKWKEWAQAPVQKFSSELAFSDAAGTVETLQKLMKDTGFKVLLTDAKVMEQPFEDIDNYLDKTMRNFPFIDKVPSEKLPELKEDFRTILTNITGDKRDTKKFIHRYECIAVVGEKI